MPALPTLLDHLVFRNTDCGPQEHPLASDLVWLRLRDARVLVLRVPLGRPRLTLGDMQRLAAALADDPRGMEVHLHLPGQPPITAEVAYRLCPDPRLELNVPPAMAQRVADFCTALDSEVMALLRDLATQGGVTWASVRNYNRMVLLDETLRQRRLQALQRFGALVAPVLLTAHGSVRRGDRDAWREHDDDVLDAIDLGRDLTGTLAAHYGIKRALVRAQLCRQPLPIGQLALPKLLILLDGIPTSQYPAAPADLARYLPYLDALAELAVGNTLALRALGAAVFRTGWLATWTSLLRHQNTPNALLGQRLHNLRDFLAAAQRALQDSGQLGALLQPVAPDAPEDDLLASTQTRLALLWLNQRGLGSLLRASQRWHAWTLQAHDPAVTPTLVWPALLGQWSHESVSAHECLSAADLAIEGQSMGHCVGSYDARCAQHGHRIVHLALADGCATLQVEPRLHDPLQRFAQAELLGPDNQPVSRTMQAWALWVLRRINQSGGLTQRQAVLVAAAVERQRAAHHRPVQTTTARIDPASAIAWQALLLHGFPTLVPRWRAGQALLDCELAGADHHGAPDCWEQLAAGQILTLVREPANVHDALAVRVDSAYGVLGYVPRPRNRRIAQALDVGIALQARLTGLSDRYEWGLRLWVRIKCCHFLAAS